MKRISLFLFLLAAFGKLSSQINDNCINAIPLCSTPSFTFFANSGPGSIEDFSITSTVSNPLTNPFPPTTGCLSSGELNPQWLILTIGNAGILEFVFGAGNSANPQAGFYDWSMWPYSPTTCAGIFNNTLPPIRCNWNGSAAGGTGLASLANITAVGGSTANFGAPLVVNACQQFVICISNFSSANTLVSFLSLGTASLSCSPNCNPSYSICKGSSATIFPVNYAALSNPGFTILPSGQSNTTGSFVVQPTVTTTYTTLISGLNLSNVMETISATAVVTVNPMPTAAPTITQTTCTSTLNSVDLNIGFDPVAALGTYSINWSPIPNGLVNPNQPNFSGAITPGIYNATITTNYGCAITTSFNITPPPDPINLIVQPLGLSHTVTCYGPVILNAVNASYNYTWSSNVDVFTGQQAVFTATSAGTWVLNAINPTSGCVDSQTFSIFQDLAAPSSSVFPLQQNINCNLNSVTTVTAIGTPSINVTHQIMAPQGGTFAAQSYTTIYVPGGVGTFTHCMINDANGCKSCNTFSVSSAQGFPTYSVVSPQSFTLGCGTKSLATLDIVGGQTTPPGGGLTYTIIGPPTSTFVPTGTLGISSNFILSVPGTWTVITKDNSTFCETRTPISILSNTLGPDISVVVPQTLLNCNVPRITLRGQSLTNNVAYTWAFPGTPGNLQSDTISVGANTLAPTNSVVANYTLTVVNNNSTCRSFSVVPILQSLYPPKAGISGGNQSLTCNVHTVVLTNQSSTGVPPSTGFPFQQPAVGYVWQGPTPQTPAQMSSSYVGGMVGIYTLTVKDLNNGCLATATANIADGRDYPKFIKSGPVLLKCGQSEVTFLAQVIGTPSKYTFTWTPPSPDYKITPVENKLTAEKTGLYRVTIKDKISGCTTFGDITVINDTLKAAFEAQPVKGFAPLKVDFYNNSRSNDTILSQAPKDITAYWNFSNGKSAITTAANTSTFTTFNSPGTYTVAMYVVKGECMDTAYTTIQVEVASELEIPNVFTPNGDNVNDLFFVKAANLAEISVLIYDRWGHVVYEVKSKTGNISWDGKNHEGKEVAEGTYFYIIKAEGRDVKPYNKKGTISLFR